MLKSNILVYNPQVGNASAGNLKHVPKNIIPRAVKKPDRILNLYYMYCISIFFFLLPFSLRLLASVFPLI